ncbi:MAG: HAMP domain-containing sensor histidine kinase [Candidatus Sericytochromatia bacterium]|nr:HAMP domain-containing sensor histidine kinase [Candidatus Sericytochromatia bacterium]
MIRSVVLRLYGVVAIALLLLVVVVVGLVTWSIRRDEASLRAMDRMMLAQGRWVSDRLMQGHESARLPGAGEVARARDEMGMGIEIVPWDAVPEVLRRARTEVAIDVKEGTPGLAWLKPTTRLPRVEGMGAQWPVAPGPGGLAVKGPGYWVRLGSLDQPLGAAHVIVPAPVPDAPPMVRYPWLGPVVLGFILIPPLWLWVVIPLRRIQQRAHQLALGDLETPVPRTRRDEFGDLEETLEGMRARLAELMASKDRLLSDVSHELRAPLSRAFLAISLVQADAESAPYVARVRQDLEAIERLVGELLEAARSRRHSGEVRTEVDLAEVARALVRERELMPEEMDVRFSMTLSPCRVLGDERLLARAVRNLLDNAWRYTPKGGHIFLEVGTEGRQARVCVVDDGPGIPAEHLDKVTEPFYRADGSRARTSGGVGLGLAIVKGIAERHGGRLELISPASGGTRASLLLPAL